MEEIATSTINVITPTAGWWQTLPAAAYVLLGVIISGIFTVLSSWLNNRGNKEIKRLENENGLKLKDLENENANKLKTLETESNEKIQTQNQEAQKALRLLDDKLKCFSEFYHNYSEILVSGTNKERQQRIEAMRKTTYRVRLLAPSVSTELTELGAALNEYGNFYLRIISGRETLTKEQEKAKIKAHIAKIGPLVNTIFTKLTTEI